MKQVIYSPAHKGLKEYPLMEKPEPFEEFAVSNEYDVQQYKDFRRLHQQWEREYQEWLSSPPIAIVMDEHVAYFSGFPVDESMYEIDYVEDGIDRNGEKKYKAVAIPKEGNNAPNKLLLSDSLVSHTGTVGNSIREVSVLLIEKRKKFFDKASKADEIRDYEKNMKNVEAINRVLHIFDDLLDDVKRSIKIRTHK